MSVAMPFIVYSWVRIKDIKHSIRLDSKTLAILFSSGAFDSFSGWSGQKLTARCMLLLQLNVYRTEL